MPGNKKRENLGFTLMEMVVVIAIFSALMLIILNVFMLALQAQRQTSSRQQVLANLRYIMETMAQKVRTSEIDYQYYEGSFGGIPDPADNPPNSSVNVLALIDQAGNKFFYKDIGGVIKQTETGNEDNSFALTDPDQVTIIKMAFYINPKTNPFAEERCNADIDGANVVGCQNTSPSCTVSDGNKTNLAGFCGCGAGSDCLSKYCRAGLCQPFDFQPRVTIVLGFESVAAKAQERKTIYLQTTVSSRVYKR